MRQVVIFGIDAGVLFVLYFLLEGFAFTLAVIVLTAVAMTLAFVKINEQPLTKIIFSVAQYFLQPRVYLWGREEKKAGTNKKPESNFMKNIKQLIGGEAPPPKLPKEIQEEAEKEPTTREIKEVAELLDQ